jgi:hypothetical protein
MSNGGKPMFDEKQEEQENPYEPEFSCSKIHHMDFFVFTLFAVGLGFCLGAIFAAWYIG